MINDEFILQNNINKDTDTLIKNIRKKYNQLKKLYRQILVNSLDSDNERILYDNFYLLEKTYKQIINLNKNYILSCNNDNLPMLGNLILTLSEDDIFPDTTTVIKNIQFIQKQKYIKNDELDLLIWELRYVLIHSIYYCFEQPEATNIENVIDLFVLLTKSDTIETDRITEQCNAIEKIFNKEACNIYPFMDNITKSQYRSFTVANAEYNNISETEQAQKYLQKADRAFTLESREKNIHVGFYIYKDINKIKTILTPQMYVFYISFLSLIFSCLFSFFLNSYWYVIILFIPFYEIAKVIIERAFFNNVNVTYLPRMETNDTIPENAKTLITVSCLLSSPKDIPRLKQKLIRLHYSNIYDNLKICALCDLKQADVPILAEDKSVINNAEKMINSLNKKYNSKFTLIIRKRTYCKTQNNYEGYERKRGAIEQLVKYINGEQIAFSTIIGNIEFLKHCKYILALDYDTKALMGSACQLVGIAEHILNQPEIINGKVKSGYSIIAPRITTKLKSSLRSKFSKYVGGIGSSSAYDNSCSDLYQDNFNEGIFSGKGLINIKAFYEVCSDRLPENRILSHDILEGSYLKTAFAGDIEMSDNFPSNTSSYFKRLDRWERGDFQNAGYIKNTITEKYQKTKSSFTFLEKYKLIDNIRRALTSIILYSLLIISAFIDYRSGLILSLIYLISIIFPHIVSLTTCVIYKGINNFSDRYYSDIFPQSREILFKGVFSIILLPYYSYISLSSLLVTLYRTNISHKNLLSWTTSDQADKGIFSKKSVIMLYTIPPVVSIILLFADNSLTKIFALLYIVSPLILLAVNKQQKSRRNANILISDSLVTDIAAMWQFYEDYAGKTDNYLPPDNVQTAPVFRICHRTSPTNIGLMILSQLVVRDFDIIDTDGLIIRIDRTLSSVEKLKKFNGNLYNWYETKTLELSNNPFLSTVDSGNFVCCMVALKEGLKEYSSKDGKIKELIKRIETIIDNTDLSIFYDNAKGLFSIGLNPETKTLCPNYYDLLMSEARMTSYFAVAKRIVPKNHWRKLGRTLSRYGVYSGPVSYSGTMFEFFMPEIMLKSEEGSITNEGLKYCIYCQKKRTESLGIPFGISESAYYAFDNSLNYQYKAHGVQKIGLKQGLDNELVISPYSSYLAMQYDFDGAVSNLKELRKYGMYGNYGFYEAIDFTKERCQGGFSIIKSYMAHHIGMSILSLSNSLMDGKIQKRFLADNYMKSADELLSEKIISGTEMFENNISEPPEQKYDSSDDSLLIEKININDTKMKLLSNGEYTLVVSDSGACYAIYQGRDVYLRTTDILRRPQGCYFAIKTNNKHICYSYLPKYKQTENMSVEFGENTVSFYTDTDSLTSGMKIHLHSILPCEIRQFAFKNEDKVNYQNIALLSYIEPVLSSFREFEAHPAFCKLFIREHYDMEYKCIIISKTDRESHNGVYCAIGFIEEIELACNLSREQVLDKPYGVTSIFDDEHIFVKTFESIPDPCIMLKTTIELKPSEHKELNLFIMTALSSEELYQNIAKLRYEKLISTLASSAVNSDSIEGIIISTLLPQILIKKKDSKEITNCIQNNNLDVRGLWSIGISGDYPIVIIEVISHKADERIIGYIKAHRILNLCGIKSELVFLYKENEKNNKNYNEFLRSIIAKQSESWSINSAGGIYIIDKNKSDDETINLLKAISCHIAPPGMVRIGTVPLQYTPLEIVPVNKVLFKKDEYLINGGFNKDTFICDKDTTLPWCHILANQVFGTLLSNDSLGYTYAINSRENKLTPWFNDTMTDNRGEMLILRTKDCCYDIILGSTAVFSDKEAVYFGTTKYFDSKVSVSVSSNGMSKKIDIEITWKSFEQDIEIAYYTEPVLSYSSENSRMIKFIKQDDRLIATNPYNKDVKGYMCISCSDKTYSDITTRDDFLSGRWDKNNIISNNKPCATKIIKMRAKRNRNISPIFNLLFGNTINSSIQMSSICSYNKKEDINSVTINTPDANTNYMFNNWLYWQTISGRLYARTGFYQNSGAYGFRDQLQDSCCILIKNPQIAKRQIARACTAQFFEGDVLHWWHRLPQNVMRGVRTKYSDDLVWLPYTVCEYAEKTNDLNLLNIKIHYCEGIEIEEGRHEIYGEVKKSDFKDSIYKHCKKALDYAYRLGEHDLVLMGCGDWNDSFNNVGIKGKGESVWLSEFMIVVMKKFAELAEKTEDTAYHDELLLRCNKLINAITNSCWDGEWYIRAFFDNGNELGSKNSEACQIDSLSQSFATLAHLPDIERNNIALHSAFGSLVDETNGIIKLFTPAFSKNEMPVGYATSYPRGIRENGGQYTHGAIWLAIAFLEAEKYKKGNYLIKILNPANKYLDEKSAIRYKNEPYYMSADIYTNPQCYGRGGWSIYTGAAAWYYRAIFEWFIGIKIKYGYIYIKPNISCEWDEYDITMKYQDTNFHFTVAKGPKTCVYDNDTEVDRIAIDGQTHEIRIVVSRERDN